MVILHLTRIEIKSIEVHAHQIPTHAYIIIIQLLSVNILHHVILKGYYNIYIYIYRPVLIANLGY